MSVSNDPVSAPEASGDFSRRRFLRFAGGIAGTTVVPLLAACVPASPVASPTRLAGVAPTSIAAGTAIYPTYVPISSGPKPDYAAAGPEYSDGFDTYPANPAKAVAQAPGTGGTVNIMSIQLFPPPTPLDQNPAWQAVNKALNADVRFNIVTSADYPVKLGTMMASSDLPDVIYMYARPGSASTLAATSGVPQFLQAKAEDLTPYLAGDAAKEYPNLAAIPTNAWKNAGCAYQGRLYMVPIHRYLPGQMFVKNTAIWDKELGADYVPKDADDFKRVLQTLTRPQEDFYGIGTGQGTLMMLPGFAAMFGAPNGWRQSSDGKLVKDLETPEYKEAVAYARDLWASGVFHPNSTSWASNVIARAQFAGSKFAVHRDPINGWQDSWRQALNTAQPFDVRPLPAFAARAGSPLQHFVTGGHLWATALKKGSPERIKELLRIMNWIAAPFGTQEHQLMTFGVEGIDYSRDASGNPVVTPQGNADAYYVPWKYTVGARWVFYTPDLPNYAKVMYDTEHLLMPHAVSDPSFGQVSATNFTKGFTLQQAVEDTLVDIVVGRRPMADYDQMVRDWLNNGGEAIRKEYQESIAATP
jgi:putative aldouronate transport system substrate-binding protein